MSKNVILSGTNQQHNTGGGGGKIQERYNDSNPRPYNDRQQNQQRQNNDGQQQRQNNDGQQRRDNAKNNDNNNQRQQPQAPPVRRPGNGKRPIYQTVFYLRIDNSVFIVPADNDWRYEDNLIVDTRRPRTDVEPSGYIYALEGVINLVDRHENPTLCEEIDHYIADFYDKINIMLEYATEYQKLATEPAKRIRKAGKNAKNDDEAVVVAKGIPTWLKVALISVFAVICAALILIANSGVA